MSADERYTEIAKQGESFIKEVLNKMSNENKIKNMSDEKHCIELAEQGEFDIIRDEFPEFYLKYFASFLKIRNFYLNKHYPERLTDKFVYVFYGDADAALEQAKKNATSLALLNKFKTPYFILDTEYCGDNWQNYNFEEIVININPERCITHCLTLKSTFQVDVTNAGGRVTIRPKIVFVVSPSLSPPDEGIIEFDSVKEFIEFKK